MARPRQPVDLLLYKGNKHLTKKEIEERKAQEVKAENDKVEAPEELSEELKVEFNEISEELLRIGIMSNLDVNALVLYIEAYNEYKFIKKKSEEIKNEADFNFEQYKEYQKLMDMIKKQCRSLASDLGLTITSRCRLVIPKKEEPKEKSKKEKMFGDKL